MRAASGKEGYSESRAAAGSGYTHPAWRRTVAGGMAIIFALTLAVVGLMLCVGPAIVP